MSTPMHFASPSDDGFGSRFDDRISEQLLRYCRGISIFMKSIILLLIAHASLTCVAAQSDWISATRTVQSTAEADGIFGESHLIQSDTLEQFITMDLISSAGSEFASAGTLVAQDSTITATDDSFHIHFEAVTEIFARSESTDHPWRIDFTNELGLAFTLESPAHWSLSVSSVGIGGDFSENAPIFIIFSSEDPATPLVESSGEGLSGFLEPGLYFLRMSPNRGISSASGSEDGISGVTSVMLDFSLVVVPEPSTLVLFFLGNVFLIHIFSRRRTTHS